jgi:hypothetical protein
MKITKNELRDKTEDKFGIEIKVNSVVLFSSCSRDIHLYVGKIEKIKQIIFENGYSQIKLYIRNLSTNFLNQRLSKDVINFECYKEYHSEFFI